MGLWAKGGPVEGYGQGLLWLSHAGFGWRKPSHHLQMVFRFVCSSCLRARPAEALCPSVRSGSEGTGDEEVDLDPECSGKGFGETKRYGL